MRQGTASDIRIGEPLPYGIYDLAGTLLLSAGTAIATHAQRERLIERGFMVADGFAGVQSEGPAANDDAHRRADDVPVFLAVRDVAHKVQALHQNLLLLKADGAPGQAETLAGRIEELANRDLDAALASLQLHMQEGDFGSRFVHAAFLCWILGKALGFDADQRSTLSISALLYDVALTPVSKVLNNQRAPLTAEQRGHVHAHPQQAYDLLLEAGFANAEVLRAVLEHHERLDGTGYPRGLAGEEISMAARILGIVDSFSAMVRPRAYREAVHCKQALRDIFIQRSKSADERLVNLLVKEIGMYPPGSLVKLQCGDVAVVFSRGQRVQSPIVRVLLYSNGGRALTHPLRNTCDIGADVVEGLPAGQYGSILNSINHLWLDRP